MATKKQSGCSNIAMGIFMILGGIIMGIAGLYFAFQSWQLVSNGSKVDAVVVDLEYSPKPSSGGRPAAPIYEYTVDGQTYTFRSKTKSNPHPLIGDHQTLLYDPKNPANASEDTFMDLWLLPAIACPASVLLIFAAVIVMAFGRFFGISRKPPKSGFSISI